MKLVYLMGAGRSGTTLLASVLGNASQIMTLGEMHQFLDHLIEDRNCSCGLKLTECAIWTPLRKKLLELYTMDQLKAINLQNNKIEGHSHIVSSLFSSEKTYLDFQERLFQTISHLHPSHCYLDSAKYISRALQLSRSKVIETKIIYVIRDVRGVINSFGKNVQTPKGPFGTIVYYASINFFAQWVYWILGKKKVMKLRYEDFITRPQESIRKIEKFTHINLEDLVEKVESTDHLNIPHFIGGNRMAAKGKLKIKADLQWKESQSRGSQLLYYFLSLPTMLLNRYRP